MKAHEMKELFYSRYRISGVYPAIFFISMCCIFLANSCTESTINPFETPEQKLLQTAFAKRWFITQSGNSGDSTTIGLLLEINEDGTFERSSPYSPLLRGRWRVNADSTITLIPDNNTNSETFKIIELSGERLRYKSASSNAIISFEVFNKPLFRISGSINFKNNIPITVRHRLSVVWKVRGGTLPSYSFAWGTGDLNLFSNRFTIEFYKYPPDSTLSLYPNCPSKLAVGYIYLHSDITSPEKGKLLTLEPVNVIGSVPDRSIVYVFGDPTYLKQNCNWASNFSAGYNLGSSQTYIPGTPALFTPTMDFDGCSLKVSQQSSDLKVAEWRW